MTLRLKCFLIFLPISLLLAVVVGCGKGDAGPPRYDVSGTVTYEGKPVPQGTIQFQPDTSKGNSGPAANAEIVNGQYDTSKQGSGTVGGPHRVIIQGYDGNAKPEEELPLGMPLFSEYGTTADMPKSVDGGTVDFQVDTLPENNSNRIADEPEI